MFFSKKIDSKKWQTLALGLQHTFTMFGSVVLVPTILGLNISVAIFMAGIMTIIFQIFTKGKVPIFLGSSFEYIPPLVAAGAIYGMEYALGGVVICGLVYVIASIAIYYLGPEKIVAIFPPVLTGSIAIALGLVLAPHAIELASSNWALAIIAFTIVSVINIRCKGFTKILSIVIGLLLSYFIAILVTILFHIPLVDFTGISNVSLVGIPKFTFAKFNLGATLLILPYSICAIVDHVGDLVVTSAICKKDFVKDPGINRTLLGSGIAGSVSSFFGGPPNATYSENVGVLALTKNYNPKTLRIAAYCAIIIGFIPKISEFIMSIPDGIIGGVLVVLFGTIVSMGINQFIESNVDFKIPKNIMLVAIVLILSVGGASIKFSIGDIKFALEGLGLAAIVGVIYNGIFIYINKYKK